MQVELADGGRIGPSDPEWDESGMLDFRSVELSRMEADEQFVYVFDLGDDWPHLGTVGSERIDPAETPGIVPARPRPYWGGGAIPDQYGRRWDGDDGESAPPKDPSLVGLTLLRPWWGPQRGRP